MNHLLFQGEAGIKIKSLSSHVQNHRRFLRILFMIIIGSFPLISSSVATDRNPHSGTDCIQRTGAVDSYSAQLFLPNSKYRPYAVHFDNRGSMFIVTGDAAGNGFLKRVTPAGEETDIAALKGSFIGPGLDMDAEGNFYIPLGDHVVKVTPDGTVSTLFESAPMGIRRALDLVLDPMKNIYIVDDKQDMVFKIDTSLQCMLYLTGTSGIYQVDMSTSITVGEHRIQPSCHQLNQNYPNPFNTETTIHYVLLGSMHVNIKIFNLLGQAVVTLVDGHRPAGDHQVIWDAFNQPGGLYICRMEAGDSEMYRKMQLMK